MRDVRISKVVIKYLLFGLGSLIVVIVSTILMLFMWASIQVMVAVPLIFFSGVVIIEVRQKYLKRKTKDSVDISM